LFEGIDGSGKTTIINYLLGQYPNYELLQRKEEFAKVIGEGARKKYLKDCFNEYKDKKVFVDRFHISEVVYNETLRGIKQDLNEMEKEIFGDDINKVILITLTVEADIANERIKKRDGKISNQDLEKENSLFGKHSIYSDIGTKMQIKNDYYANATSLMVEKEITDFVERNCLVKAKILEK
jgi:thymidylate kinase